MKKFFLFPLLLLLQINLYAKYTPVDQLWQEDRASVDSIIARTEGKQIGLINSYELAAVRVKSGTDSDALRLLGYVENRRTARKDTESNGAYMRAGDIAGLQSSDSMYSIWGLDLANDTMATLALGALGYKSMLKPGTIRPQIQTNGPPSVLNRLSNWWKNSKLNWNNRGSSGAAGEGLNLPGNKPVIVIGENMQRVQTVADDLVAQGYEVRTYGPKNFRSSPGNLSTLDLEANRSWLRYWTQRKGASVVDIGIDPGRSAAARSPFYQLEQRSIYQNWNYDNVTQYDPGF